MCTSVLEAEERGHHTILLQCLCRYREDPASGKTQIPDYQHTLSPRSGGLLRGWGLRSALWFRNTRSSARWDFPRPHLWKQCPFRGTAALTQREGSTASASSSTRAVVQGWNLGWAIRRSWFDHLGQVRRVSCGKQAWMAEGWLHGQFLFHLWPWQPSLSAAIWAPHYCKSTTVLWEASASKGNVTLWFASNN